MNTQNAPKAKGRDRRRFLKEGAALAGLAVEAIRSPEARGRQAPEAREAASGSRLYGERSRFETSERTNLRNPLQDQMGILTPASLHHVVSHGSITPEIDPRQHRLLIHGLVDRPLILTVEEVKRLPSVTRLHFVECASNTGGGRRGKTVQQTHGWSSCSEWTGVLLSLLLQEAGVQRSGSWILAEGAEPRHHWKSIPMVKAMDDCLVCYGQNGEAARPDNGYPLRLLVPGFEGVNNIKWLRRIRVVDQPYMSRLETTGYPSLRPDGKARWFQFEMGPISVITRPSGEQRLPGPGFYEITGLAWSGGGAISRVEVSTDGGRTWKQAQLQEPIHRKAHTLFRLPWTWNGEETILQSRATDELGQTQPTLAKLNQFWGVGPDYFKTTDNYINHFNPIFPWGVTREGSVYSALFS